MSTWYWCLDHARVEPVEGCKNASRLGPYATRPEAEVALETARLRTEAWEAEDARWEDEGWSRSSDPGWAAGPGYPTLRA